MRPKFRKPTSVLITGGSSGIGKAIAMEAVGDGCKVFVVARDRVKLDAAISEIQQHKAGSQVAGMSASVTDSAALEAAVEAAEAQHGPIDLLVNSAGMPVPGYFEDLSIDDFSSQIDVNYLGTVRTIQAVLPGMKSLGHGWIVNVSSVAGFKGVFGYTAYCGSKFAVNGFSEALRAELERYNIGVSLVCPPDTRTPGLEAEEASKPEETKKLSAAGTLLEPEEVARAVWTGLRRSKVLITPGYSANMVRLGNRLSPSLIDWMLRRAIR
jgi:3-dehydrosphinganine reductase